RRRRAVAAGVHALPMIHLTRALVRRWLDALLHIDDSPERTAAAFALGVFFGFSPFLGFHTILGVVFAFLLNLNRVAVLLGVYSNLPIVIAPYYAFVKMTAMRIAGHRAPPGSGFRLKARLDRSGFPGGFLSLYEATTLDSRYAARQATLRETTALPAPGVRLAFSATAYCKGVTTASGVAAQSGVAAADPELLPGGSVVEVASDDPRYS